MSDRVKVNVFHESEETVFRIYDGTKVMVNVRLKSPTGLDELEDFVRELKKALIFIYQERVNRL